MTTIHTGRQVEVYLAWLAEDAIATAETFPGGDRLRTCLAEGHPQSFVFQPGQGTGTFFGHHSSAERDNATGRKMSQSPAASGPDGGLEVFAEPVLPCPLLLIAGGGHVGQALAVQAAQVGFQVTVLDDRPEFADPARFPPGVRVCCGPPAEQLARLAMDADTYVVIVTRGHQHDAEALAACIHGRSAYLGMIGSRRKVALIRQSFLDGGLATEGEFARVFAPVGLEIGAVTVPEIATSIVAQLIAVRRKAVAQRGGAAMIVAVVPAAGQSRRMGTPKPLLPFGGTTVIGHVVDALLGGSVDEVRVVVGHEADLVARALGGGGSASWSTPITGTLRCWPPCGALCGQCRRAARRSWWPWAISRRLRPSWCGP